MEKNLLFSLFFLCLIRIGYTQDFEPGNDAQGYLQKKNAMVDHATGTFHYSVPLMEISSGGLSIPISLGYSSNIESSSKGLIGEHWNIQTGGVITRTIRGGIADEVPGKGFIHQNSSETISDQIYREINKHNRDGESDIFTASFNGKSVSFIIKKENNLIVPEFLERSNIKLTCEYDGTTIKGWRLVDEYGVEYIYNIVEWTSNINRESAITIYDINDKTYISSWYLSEIIIPNGNNIIYEYALNDIITPDKTLKTYGYSQNSFLRLAYKYGTPMMELCFDWNKEKDDLFHYYMNEASIYVNSLPFQERLKNEFMEIYGVSQDIRSLEGVIETISKFNTILGSATNFADGFGDAVKIVNQLTSMIEACQNMNYYDLEHNILRPARSIMIGAINGKRYTDTTSVSIESKYIIATPVLKSISTENSKIEFISNNRLSEIILKDYKNDEIKRVSLSYWAGNSGNYNLANKLQMLEWLDLNGELVQKQTFGYASTKQLNKIVLTDGGMMELTYEPNVYDSDLPQGYRISSIHIIDSKTDIIKYRYPYSGKLVYNASNSNIVLSYNDFVDKVKSTNIINSGNVYINRGNNGIFYHYIEEELLGKGFNTYLFSIPSNSSNGTNGHYSFWIAGLPLAKASYNSNGNLVFLQKYKYYTDLNSSNFQYGSTFFENHVGLEYSNQLQQAKPNEFFIDTDSISKYYRSIPSTKLYIIDRITHEINPYDYYNANIAPRAQQTIEEPRYKFYYGGKTLLKENKSYLFSAPIQGIPSINHLEGTIPSGAILSSEIEYVYDNITNHTRPTRIIRTESNGDKIISLRRTPLDFQSSIGIFTDMIYYNFLDYSVKEQNLLQKKNSNYYHILSEEIKSFVKKQFSDGSILFVPEKTFRYIGTGNDSIPIVTSALDNSLLTLSESKYTVENYNYEESNEELLLTQLNNNNNISVFGYDKGRNNLIVQSEGISKNNIDAIDKYRILFNSGKIYNPIVGGDNLLNYLTITPYGSTTKYKVMLYIKPSTTSLDLKYTLTRSAGNVSLNTSSITVVPGKWQLACFNIDLSSYSTVSKITVNLTVSGEVANAVLAPVHVTFVCMSFDSIGNLFCKFDQNGNVERNEYDAAGRIYRIYDKNGNVLKEYNYSLVK